MKHHMTVTGKTNRKLGGLKKTPVFKMCIFKLSQNTLCFDSPNLPIGSLLNSLETIFLSLIYVYLCPKIVMKKYWICKSYLAARWQQTNLINNSNILKMYWAKTFGDIQVKLNRINILEMTYHHCCFHPIQTKMKQLLAF